MPHSSFDRKNPSRLSIGCKNNECSAPRNITKVHNRQLLYRIASSSNLGLYRRQFELGIPLIYFRIIWFANIRCDEPAGVANNFIRWNVDSVIESVDPRNES